ncbi:TonB family protein [Scytonema sp. UIC 10036]|uniref:energy transducer TonB n=1 Tax=Scytonema sp. UIC 10036 TaxID=2304196 RepID=UPI0012DA2025|nr:energy transducer TonB [Scytonema sp. UIC 10036]MUG96437.1 TonB family protein [Scytonema sp. UIC 10036]
MSFSGTALEHREKESKALRTFLTFSLVGSLGLHIGVLASGVANLVMRVQPMEDEPIELIVLDSPKPIPQKTKPPEPPKQVKLPEPPKPVKPPEPPKPTRLRLQPQAPVVSKVVKTPQGGGGKTAAPAPKAPPVPQPVPPQQTVVTPEEKPILPPLRDEIKKPQRILTQVKPNLEPQPEVPLPSKQEVPVTEQKTENLQPPLRRPRIIPEVAKNTVPAPSTSSESNDFSNRTRRLRSTAGTPGSTGEGTGGGSGGGIGTGTGSGTGSGTGTQVATAPKPRPAVTKFDFVDCLKCDLKYPERAERRGIEGKPGITFDVDENGNVINIKLTRSSGHKELDEALVSQAREFKLNAAAAGKQNVQLIANFTKSGSRENREALKRQQEREERRRQQQAEAEKKREAEATATNETEATPGRRRRRMISDSPATPTSPSLPSRKPESTVTPTSPVIPSQQPESTVQPLEQSPSASPSPSNLEQTPPSNENDLLDSLRRSQEQPQP